MLRGKKGGETAQRFENEIRPAVRRRNSRIVVVALLPPRTSVRRNIARGTTSAAKLETCDGRPTPFRHGSAIDCGARPEHCYVDLRFRRRDARRRQLFFGI